MDEIIQAIRDAKKGCFARELDPNNTSWYEILMMAVGKVSRIIVEKSGQSQMIGQLIEVAAIAVCWMEANGRCKGLETEDAIFNAIVAEVARQDVRQKGQNHIDLYWLGTLVEKIGKVAERLVEWELVDDELVQVVGAVVVWLGYVRRCAAGWDPESPCEHWEPGKPYGDCESDGHYRCRECRNYDPEKL
jgi:hypothetical protein